MLLGAYGFAISITQGWPLFVAIIIGLLVAFVFALVLGVPTLKLRGDYLAIVTISAAEIVRYVGRSVGYEKLFDLTGGAQGIPGSQYRGPFTDLSPFGGGNTSCSRFNYTDVAGGSTVWVRLLGWARRDRPDLDGDSDRPRKMGIERPGRARSRWSASASDHPGRVLPRSGHPAEHRRRRLVVHHRRLGRSSRSARSSCSA